MQTCHVLFNFDHLKTLNNCWDEILLVCLNTIHVAANVLLLRTQMWM